MSKSPCCYATMKDPLPTASRSRARTSHAQRANHPATDTSARASSRNSAAHRRNEGPSPRPNAWFLPKYDRRALLDDIPQTCNATNGRIEQTCLYLDDQSAADWLAVCSVCASLRQAGAVDLRLYLLDISHCLLAVAHKHAIESFGGAVHVDALRGDFHHMGRGTLFCCIRPTPFSPARERMRTKRRGTNCHSARDSKSAAAARRGTTAASCG